MKKPSPFASFHTKTLTKLPGVGADESVVIRKLNDTRMARAAAAVQTKALQQVEAMGGMSVLNLMDAVQDKAAAALGPEAIEAAKKANAARLEAIRKDPYLAYDRDTLLVEGVVSWTFQDDRDKGVPVTAEMIEDMRADLKERIARDIFEYAQPTEEATKNESAPSSVN